MSRSAGRFPADLPHRPGEPETSNLPFPGLGEPEGGLFERYRTFWTLLGLGAAAVLVVLALAYGQYMLGQEPHRVIKVVVGAIIALIFFARPVISLGMISLTFAYLQWLPVSPIPTLNALNLIFFSLLAGWAGQTLLVHKRAIDPCPWNAPVVLFVIWVCFEWLRAAVMQGYDFSTILELGSSLWNGLAGLLLFFPIFNSIRTWKQIRVLALLFCVGSALGLFGLLREAGQGGWNRRVGGGAGQINVTGAYYASVLLFCIGLLSAGYTGLWRRLLLFGSTVGAGICLTLPGSRGAFVGFIVGVLPQALRAGVIWVVVLGLVVGGFVLWAPQYVKDRLLETTETLAESEGDVSDAMNVTGSGRIDFWKATLQLVGENPILGVGYARVASSLRPILGEARVTHNQWLETAAELGIPGLLLMLWLFIAGLAGTGPLLRHRGFPRGLGIACQGAIVAMMVSNVFGGRFFAFNMNGMLALLLAFVFRARQLLLSGVYPESQPSPPPGAA